MYYYMSFSKLNFGIRKKEGNINKKKEEETYELSDEILSDIRFRELPFGEKQPTYPFVLHSHASENYILYREGLGMFVI